MQRMKYNETNPQHEFKRPISVDSAAEFVTIVTGDFVCIQEVVGFDSVYSQLVIPSAARNLLAPRGSKQIPRCARNDASRALRQNLATHLRPPSPECQETRLPASIETQLDRSSHA